MSTWRLGLIVSATLVFCIISLAGLLSADQLVYTYDGRGRLVSATMGAGRQITYSYDEADNILEAVLVHPDNTLRVRTTPEGAGSVTASGISCPGDCLEVYVGATPITLDALPEPGFVFVGWAGDASGASDPLAVTVDRDMALVAHFAASNGATDPDGVPDVDEMGPAGDDPLYDGDSNGVPDYQEGRVASLSTFDGSGYVTFFVSETSGAVLGGVAAVANPSPGDEPADYRFPCGFFTFTVAGLEAGGCTVLTMYAPLNEDVSTYFKHGATPADPMDHWFEFTHDGTVGSSVMHEGDRTVVTMDLCDGLTGDTGPSGDGTITDPGGPARPRCMTEPVFDGVRAVGGTGTAGCGLEVSWWPAEPECGSGATYDVYRSTTSGFTPDQSTLVASCLGGTSWVDDAVDSGVEYFYVVHAEDDSTDGDGQCAAGNVNAAVAEASGVTIAAREAFVDDMEAATDFLIYQGPGHQWDPFHYYDQYNWRLDAGEAHSPAAAWRTADHNGLVDHALEIDRSFVVPVGRGGRLTFWQRLDMGVGWDGGVLEYSTDGGGSWNDILDGDDGTVLANPGRILVNGYDMVLYPEDGAFGERLAWSADDAVWEQVVVDLTDLEGLEVRFRWRFGTDDDNDDSTWHLDDFEIIETLPEIATVFSEDLARTAWTIDPPELDDRTWELVRVEESWRYLDLMAASRQTAWYVQERVNDTDDKRLELAAQELPVGTGTWVLDFWFAIETLSGAVDGAVLEYSTDDGRSWYDALEGDGFSIGANPDRFLIGGYDGVLGGDGPLAGRPAWFDLTWGFEQARLDLADFAGLSVGFRWRFGGDSEPYGGGYFLDDVRFLYEGTCADSLPPRVEWVAIPDGTTLIDGMRTNEDVDTLNVVFSKPVSDPPGDTGDDVTNPANYLLTEAGPDGFVDTISCLAGVVGDDIAVAIGPVSYAPQTWTAELVLNAGVLPSGLYQLLVCGTTTIVDLDLQPLDGDGDGTGGDDAATRFTIDTVAPVVAVIDSVEDTGDGRIDEDEVVTVEIDQLLVEYDEPMADPAGHYLVGDVSNPQSYLLVSDGGDGTFETTSCGNGLAPTDLMPAGPSWTIERGPTSALEAAPWRPVYPDDYAQSRVWHVPFFTAIADERLTLTAAVDLPIGNPARLEFQNFFYLYSRRAGGVLEYSVDGGESWFDIRAGDGASIPANSARFLSGGYNNSLYDLPSNPLGGRSAWTHRSFSWITTEVDLADFAGHQLLLRWRYGNDVTSSWLYPGWYVDDVRIHTTAPEADLFFEDLENLESLSYDDPTATTTLTVNGGAPLPDGRYRLLVCGSSGLADVAGNPLDGDGNGTGGDDFVRSFVVARGGSLLPTNPTVTCTSHTVGVWSGTGAIDFTWSGAVDGGNGIAGYSIVIDGLPTTEPDTVVEVAHGTDPHLWSSGSVGDGFWYFHLRTCDPTGQCSDGIHLGAYRVDTTSPGPITDFESSTHDPNTPSSVTEISISWTAPVEAGSGFRGYAMDMQQTPDWTCPQVENVPSSVTSFTTPPIPDGSWWFVGCSVDNVGNWSTEQSFGPYIIDTVSPVVDLVHSVAPTADGVLDDQEETELSITQLGIEFGEDMKDPPGDVDPDDVTNPANYLLVSSGADGLLETISCAALGGDDVQVTVDSAAYGMPTEVSVLRLQGGLPLPEGSYRLLACGALTDLAGNALDGNGDDDGGDPFVIDFVITESNLLGNPNFDDDLSWWDVDGLQLGWQATDAWAWPTSGSARFDNGPSDPLVLSQCVPVEENTSYLISGLVWTLLADPDAPSMGGEVEFFSTPDCSSGSLGIVATPTIDGDTGGSPPGVWFGGAVLAPPGAQAGRARFVVDAAGATFFDGAFDEVVLRKLDLLFADGFESGNSSAWSATTP